MEKSYVEIAGERWELYGDYLPSEGGKKRAEKAKEMLKRIGYRARVRKRVGKDLQRKRMVHYQVLRRKK